jgi:hypothetical protein
MADSTPVKLVRLYKDMYELTKNECAHTCRAPHSCCDSMYCEMTSEWTKEKTGAEWPKTNHPALPYMGPTGCVVPPHLRPICTVHTCEINGVGVKKGDPKWTEAYFKLRGEIEEEEYKR